MINILIADDHQLLIDGIKSTIDNIEDFSVAGEAHNGLEVLKMLEEGASVDIILMDINMPMMDGLECTRTVTKNYPSVKVIVLSQYDEKRFVKQMVKNGAMGYILKDTGKESLEKAIRSVYAGEKSFSDKLMLRFINAELKDENKRQLFPKLTKRELEILNLLGQECSTQEIADRLFISFHTVESHRANLMYKAGVKNTAGLMRWAVENDLLD